MHKLNVRIALLCAIFAVTLSEVTDVINKDIGITEVKRAIDLTTHLPKIVSIVALANSGSSSVTSFVYAIEPSLSDNLAFIGAVVKSRNEDDEKLEVVKTKVAGTASGQLCYRITLPSPLTAGSEVSVEVETVFSHVLTPYPARIIQSEKQHVKFSGNVYEYTPYPVAAQTTTVRCTTSSIESYSKSPKPAASADSVITYGPYGAQPSYAQADLSVHYENNSPFLAVTQMTRTLEVSHWGNVAVEETFDVRHTGAELKGPFSRFDFQRSQHGVSAVKSFKTQLPGSAQDVYYRDEIGNISTSHLRELDDQLELELRPRFPLFGGWKTHYYIGYNVPSYQYLYNKGDRYVLKMRFIDHVFDDQIIDDATVKIILPEGASDIKLEAPYPVQQSDNELVFTYMDTVGRPVVVANKKNLVEQHIQDFEVHYTFAKMMLLQEPLLAVSAFYLLFIAVIIYVRLDFSISKDEASESRMRIAGLVEEIQGIQDRRSALYQSYEDAINKYKSSKDVSSFNANRKRIDADHKQLTGQITALLAKLKSEGSDNAERVSELQQLDRDVRDQITLAIQWAEKLIAGKVSKQVYLDNEAAIQTKRNALLQKAEDVLGAL